MAIKFLAERKKQKYLIVIFLIVVLVTFIVIWQGFLKKEEVIPVVISPSQREIKINFEILESPTLINFQPFEEIPPLLFGVEEVSLLPSLSWQSVSGAEIYLWEVIGVESGSTKETSVTMSKKLKPSTTYTWRVKACKEDMSECSAWSDNCQNGYELRCQRFTTIKQPSLILISPSPQAENLSLLPSLSWQSVSGAEIYLWEVIGVESGSTKETSVTMSKKLKPSTTYTWRVKACKEDMSECSAWSSRTFATAPALIPPELTSPSIKETFIGRENPFLPY